MKVENTDYGRIQDANAQRVENPAATRTDPASGQDHSRPADRVDISPTSQQIDSLRDALQSVPDVRADRVEELRAAVQNGTYNVSAGQIADKIIVGDRG